LRTAGACQGAPESRTKAMKLEEVLVSVWQQALVEEAKQVELAGQRYSVQRTPRLRLRQVDFEFEGEAIRGIEQNPQTGSRWAELARAGKKVMQFTSAGRFFANVADGNVTLYHRTRFVGRKPDQ